MLKTLAISAAASALLISGALAQDTSSTASAASKNATETKSPDFIKAQGTDKWVFSKFKGTDVIGADNQKVGSVTDLLFDKNGKIDGLIVGVGGFLHIGEKNVAIDMKAFKVEPYVAPAATTGAGGNSATASEPDPTRATLKVSWTKDELKAAPDFEYYRVPARTAPPTGGMAPRPTAPPMPRQ
jgi:hypothetical protein